MAWVKAALTPPPPPQDTRIGFVNDPPECCQNLATAEHRRREKKQGKPFLACPKGHKQKGKEPQSGGRPGALAGSWCGSVAGVQALGDSQSCKTACPESIPLLWATQIPWARGKIRRANECPGTRAATPPSSAALQPHGWAHRRRKHPSMLAPAVTLPGDRESRDTRPGPEPGQREQSELFFLPAC